MWSCFQSPSFDRIHRESINAPASQARVPIYVPEIPTTAVLSANPKHVFSFILKFIGFFQSAPARNPIFCVLGNMSNSGRHAKNIFFPDLRKISEKIPKGCVLRGMTCTTINKKLNGDTGICMAKISRCNQSGKLSITGCKFSTNTNFHADLTIERCEGRGRHCEVFHGHSAIDVFHKAIGRKRFWLNRMRVSSSLNDSKTSVAIHGGFKS